MAKRKRRTTATVIEQRLKEGRGQGTGASYQPWLTIQDVSSTGTCSRIKGLKTGRRHELLSQHEARYFYILDWSPLVEDISPLLSNWGETLIFRELKQCKFVEFSQSDKRGLISQIALAWTGRPVMHTSPPPS